MKPRRWLLFVCLALLAAGMGLYQTVRYLERGRHLERILIDAISPAVGGSLDVGRVELGFFSAYLRDVQLAVPTSAFTIRITDIKIGLSLFKLVSTRGDFSRSIDKVILINPRLTVMLKRGDPAPVAASSGYPSAVSLKEFPVKYLFVKNGTVTLVQENAEEVVLGEAIAGKVWQGSDGVEFAVKGKLASRSRNLSLSGVVIDGGRTSRVSMRLTSARIGRPLDFGSCIVSAGTLEGTAEFSVTALPDSQPVLRSTGWLQVRGATLGIPAGGQTINEIDCRVSMDGVRWTLDSLAARWNGVLFGIKGSFDISGNDSSAVTISGRDMDLRPLFPDLPAELVSFAGSRAWIDIDLVKPGPSMVLGVRVAAGGMDLLGAPVTALHAAASADPGAGWRIQLDSLVVRTPVLQGRVSGELVPDDTAVRYTGSYEVSLDSFPAIARGVQGALSGRGHVEGVGRNATVDLNLALKALRVAGVSLGEQRLGAVLSQDRLSFWSSGNTATGITVSVTIDTVSGTRPQVSGTVSAGSSVLNLFLAQAGIDTSVVDSLALDGVVGGFLNAWTLQATLRGSMPRAHGSVALSLSPADSLGSVLRWEVNDRRLIVGDSAFALHGAGRLHNDSLVIDSIVCLGGLYGSGRLALGGNTTADIRLRYNNISIVSLLRWFAKGAGAVQSGTVSGTTRIIGSLNEPLSSSDIHVRNLSAGGLGGLETDAVIMTEQGNSTVLPLVVRKSGRIMISCDTIARSAAGRIRIGGRFEEVDLGALATELLGREHQVRGIVSGTFASGDSGFPVRIEAGCAQLGIDTFFIDSLAASGTVDSAGLRLTRLTGRDGKRCTLSATARVPWSFLGDEVGDRDTMYAQVRVKGDLLASVQKNLYSPIAGTGMGEIFVSFTGTAEGWQVGKSYVRIPRGTLSLYPFVLQKITEFSFEMTVDDSSRVTTALSGMIKNKPIKIYSTHTIPAGYEPIVIGPLDFGALLASAPKHSIELHLPGFQEIKDPLDVDPGRKGPWPAFAVSGPVDKLRLTGVLTIHGGQFTFPFMDTREMPWPFDPFPYISWELDLRPGSQNVMYFWDLEGQRRKLIRFVEAYLDPTSILQVRGRDLDKTFRLLGSLHSYRGTVFFGRTFNRRFDVGVEFSPQAMGQDKGFDNFPIIWGSAEAYSDTSRFETIKLTLQLSDPLSRGVRERGRLAMIPRVDKKTGSRPGLLDSIPNFIFHLSSDFDQTTGDAQREFFRETGMRFSSVEGAGEMVGNFGEQYLNRYFLQKLERTVARKLGLDVITIETSIASNYFNTFHNREFSGLSGQWQRLALGNLGVTVGRYFFRDNLFVKARGELIPQEQLLIPEYSLGLEVQPMRYLLMDFNYGILQGEKAIEHNPQVNLQLRLPITRFRNFLHF